MPFGFRMDGVKFAFDTLDDKPEWATVLAKTFTEFSLAEGMVGGLYGLLRHQNHEDGVRELKRLDTNKKRAEALKALIPNHFSGDAAKQLSDLIDRVLKHAEDRNRVAHSLWGINPSDPDRIYAIPVKKFVKYLASAIPNAANPIPDIEELKTHQRSYTMAELQAIEVEGAAVGEELLKAWTNIARIIASKMPEFKPA